MMKEQDARLTVQQEAVLGAPPFAPASLDCRLVARFDGGVSVAELEATLQGVLEDTASTAIVWRTTSLDDGRWVEHARLLGDPMPSAGEPVALRVPRSRGLRLTLGCPSTVTDLRSLELILEELCLRLGAPRVAVEATERPLPYAEFAHWQAELLARDEARPEKKYWQTLDLGALAGAHLAGALRTRTQPFSPRRLALELPQAIVSALHAEEQRSGVAPSAFLLTCWCVALSRASVADELVVATAFDGRVREGVRRSIGPFERTLPIAYRSSAAQTFRSAFEETAALLVAAAERQEYFEPSAFEHVGPLPFAFQYSRLEAPAGAARTSVEFAYGCSAPFEARLVCRWEGSRLVSSLDTDAAIIPPATATSLARAVEAVIAAALADDGVCVNTVSMRDGTLPAAVLVGKATAGGAARVHDLILEQAAKTPANIAVRVGKSVLTYGELSARTSTLAERLRARGVRPGDAVGICLDRGWSVLAAMVGVWRAGAAYVPLEVDLPEERVSFMVRDCGIGLVVTEQRYRAKFSEDVPALVLDDPDDLGLSPINCHASLGDDTAYVLYTSGTTGAPNGVRVGHGSMSNYLTWAVEEYGVSPDESSLVHSPFGFDLTVTTLFAPLLVGGTVVMLPPESAALEALAETLCADRYGLVKLTPSHLAALNRLAWSHTGQGFVKVLVLGGEELKAEAVEQIRRRLHGVRIVNEYGPTEATVGCTAFTVPPRWDGRVPIGTPIANTTIRVVDTSLRTVSEGIPGEILVGGAGVAPGYANRPALNAEKFVQGLPDCPVGDRYYRTGDLAVWSSNEGLIYLGRSDTQLKVRGVRIEPREVEAVFEKHPAVAESVVTSRDVPGAGKELVAFIVRDVEHAADLTASELAAFARQRLPGPFVPSQFFVVDRIPLNRNGKIDRAGLLALGEEPLGEGTPYVAPRTAIEQTLALIWSKVLRRERVGIDDNYFTLGGDSIRSIRIAGESHAHGLDVSVADVHSHPSIRALASAIQATLTRAVATTTAPFSLISEEDRLLLPPDIEDAYPLNLLQEGMIYHRAFSPKSAVYHAMISLQLEAPFDHEAMRRTIRTLVARHPLLRTSFELTRYSRPLQLVHRDAGDPLQFIDLSGLPSEQHKPMVLQWMEEEKKRGFDVDGYPLIRFMLHRLTEQTFQLTFSYHHEIVDGWSEATMLTQVLDHYLSIVHGHESEPPAPRASFRDSVALELMAIEDPAFREFWNRKLEGATLMRLPRLISGPKPDKGEREIVKIWVPFSADVASGVRNLATRLAVPVKSILLSAHLRVMSMFGGQSDVVTHTVAHGRPEDLDGADVIGLFVNSFTVRQRLLGGPWRSLIAETHQNEQETAPYRRYPMAELKRHQGREPLAETLFFLIDYHVYDRLKKWTDAELLDVMIYGESTFPFCATFRVPPLTNDLQMQIEYDRLQFSPQLIDSMISSYKEALAAMIEDVEVDYLGRDLLPPDDREVLVRHWNETARSQVECASVTDLFEEQVVQNADAIAVVHDDTQLTYAYLAAMAAEVARVLEERTPPHSVIGVSMDRSPEMLAAMWGALQSGRAYLPLDPTLRPERVAYMAGEARACAVLVQERYAAALTACGFPTLTVRAKVGLDVARGRIPARLATADAAAYVMYTSGSSGKQKGVVVSHRNLLHSTLARSSTYADVYARFLLVSSFAFDSSVAGIFGTLCRGGTLVLPAEGMLLSLDEAAGAIAREQVTHILCVSSLYSSLLEHAEAGQLESLSAVIVAGEACGKEVWERHVAAAPRARFYNEYGPTEATVWCSVWTGEPDGWRAQLPIGRPIDNTSIYILGAGLNLVPIGAPGRLHIGGGGVSGGYVADPVLTAQRFVPDPFGAPGARLYDSGDLARYRRDGQIEFLGRADDQVKVRGFRIEPQEIESILDGFAGIQRSVVQAREDQNGEKVLVAHVVPQRGNPLTVADVQAYAAEHLPKYMRPSHVVILNAFPLTAAGKLDRRALPAPDDSSAGNPAGHALPRTATEEVVAGIWATVLGRSAVGVQDSFVDLGGESLRAMRVMSRIQRAFHVSLPASMLLEQDVSVAALAEKVEMARWAMENAAAFSAATGPEYAECTL